MPWSRRSRGGPAGHMAVTGGSTTAVSAGLAGVRLGSVPSARRLDKRLEVRRLDPPETANFAPRQFAGAEPVLQCFRTQLEDGRGLFDR
jgi:hypothetical protein